LGDRIPVGTRFSAHFQTGLEAHPASYTVDTGSLQRVKRTGRGVGHTPHLAPRLKKVELYLYSLFWTFVTCSRVNITSTLTSLFFLQLEGGEKKVKFVRIKICTFRQVLE
jgi:hypothetical protein